MADETQLDNIAKHLDSLHAKMDAEAKDRKADRERMDAMSTKLDAEGEERKKADKVRADSEQTEKERKDAEEKARKDAEEKMKADAEAKAKLDAEAKAKADAIAASTSDNAKLRAELDALNRRIPAEVTAEVRQRLVGFQSKAERVAQAFGDSAPPFVNNESETDYRIRLLSKYRTLSKQYKDADLSKIQDATVFTMIEDAIYNDAFTEATHPSTVKPGVLIPQKRRDGAGREITRYTGDPNACWDQFNPPLRHVRRLLTSGISRVH